MPDITLGTYLANGTGSLVQWLGGPGAVVVGVKDGTDHYSMGTATVEVQWSDTNATTGARTLYNGGNAMITTTIAQTPMMIPQGYLRAVVTGVTAGTDIKISILDLSP